MGSPQNNAERDQSSSPEQTTRRLLLSPPRTTASKRAPKRTLSLHRRFSSETRPLAQPSTAINSRDESESQTQSTDKLILDVVGDVNEMTKDWSLEELNESRRIVRVRKSLFNSNLDISFKAVTADAMVQDGFYISCIKRDDINCYYITQDDIYRLVEWLLTDTFSHRLSADEKSQILHDLDDFNPLTVSRVKAETEDLFKLIMSLPHPQPSNFEIQIEVHRWETLLPTLETMMDKYSAYLKPYRPSIESGLSLLKNSGAVNRKTLKPLRSQLPVRTDYGPEDISPDRRQIYISGLADSFVETIKALGIEEDALNRVSVILPNLLETFALKVGLDAPTLTHHRIMNFVLENRQ